MFTLLCLFTLFRLLKIVTAVCNVPLLSCQFTAAAAPRPSDACVRLSTQPSYSTEELTQEMANLEGLMKDLNAITASEFQC